MCNAEMVEMGVRDGPRMEMRDGIEVVVKLTTHAYNIEVLLLVHRQGGKYLVI